RNGNGRTVLLRGDDNAFHKAFFGRTDGTLKGCTALRVSIRQKHKQACGNGEQQRFSHEILLAQGGARSIAAAPCVFRENWFLISPMKTVSRARVRFSVPLGKTDCVRLQAPAKWGKSSFSAGLNGLSGPNESGLGVDQETFHLLQILAQFQQLLR